MSVARGFGLNGKSLYTNITKPMEVWCNFIVDSTNGNGLGIRSLKSNGYIENVFMHTSVTPGINNGHTNPNPQSGYAFIRFKNNFNYYLGGFYGQIVPLTSTSTTSLTTGNVYTITSIGSTTIANWQTAGLPLGFIPTVGQTFISAISGSITGSGTVGVPGVPVSNTLTVVGDPNSTIANSSIASNAGAIIIVQFSALVPSGTVSGSAFTNTSVFAVTAPANGSVVGMQFCFDGSTVSIPDSPGSTGL